MFIDYKGGGKIRAAKGDAYNPDVDVSFTEHGNTKAEWLLRVGLP